MLVGGKEGIIGIIGGVCCIFLDSSISQNLSKNKNKKGKNPNSPKITTVNSYQTPNEKCYTNPEIKEEKTKTLTDRVRKRTWVWSEKRLEPER